MLPVSIVVVSIPDGSGLRAPAKQRVDDAHSVHDTLIVGIAQAEAHQRERVRAHEILVARSVRSGRPIPNRHVAGRQRVHAGRHIGRLGRRDARIVAVDAGEPREIGARDVCPALDVVVPGVGRLA